MGRGVPRYPSGSPEPYKGRISMASQLFSRRLFAVNDLKV